VFAEVEHREPGVRAAVLHPHQARRVAGGRQAQVREPHLEGGDRWRTRRGEENREENRRR